VGFFAAGLTVGFFAAGLTVGFFAAGLTVGFFAAGLTVGFFEAGLTVGFFAAGLTVGFFAAGLTVGFLEETFLGISEFFVFWLIEEFKSQSQKMLFYFNALITLLKFFKACKFNYNLLINK